MQQKLIILLHSDDLQRPSWAIVSDRVLQSGYKTSYTHLAELAATCDQVFVLVPGEQVLFTTVKLPKLSRSRLQQALPYALEEFVVEDLEKLHFACGVYTAQGELCVAVVSKQSLKDWLQLLQDWDLNVDALIPSYFALPALADGWQIAIADQAFVRINQEKAFVCDKSNVSHFLQLTLAESQQLPQQTFITYYTEDDVKINLNTPFPCTESQQTSSKQIIDFAINILQNPFINLLQGEFAVKNSRLSRNRLMHAAIALGLASLLLLLSSGMISSWILSSRLKFLDTQIATIYKKNFPQATNIVAPRLRMEEKLKQASNSNTHSRLLTLLSLIANDLNSMNDIHIKRFDFQNNVLSLDLSAANSQDLSAFTENLQSNNLKVQQQNANVVDNRINATLVIEQL